MITLIIHSYGTPCLLAWAEGSARMICKGCHSRVPDKDMYSVSCGRSLRSKWVNWLILAFVAGSLIAASVAVACFFSPRGIAITSDSGYHAVVIVFLVAAMVAIVLAVAAVFLAVRHHSLLRNVILAIIAASAFYFFRGNLLEGGVVGLLALVILAVVLILVFRRR